MVISIFIEGGVLPNENVSAQTMNNVESLRQSFYRIFNSILEDEEDISIRIIPQASYKQAIKTYLVAGEDTFLLIDLDMPKHKKEQWFNNLATTLNNPIKIPDERKENIFFMIQEMEAWILKQPDAIYKWAMEYNHYIQKRPKENLAEHTMLRNRNIEDIEKPSHVLEKLVTVFFEKSISGNEIIQKLGKVRYTKLKEGAELLDCLNVALLLAQDSELQRFKASISG